jgi:hypothetical protein
MKTLSREQVKSFLENSPDDISLDFKIDFLLNKGYILEGLNDSPEVSQKVPEVSQKVPEVSQKVPEVSQKVPTRSQEMFQEAAEMPTETFGEKVRAATKLTGAGVAAVGETIGRGLVKGAEEIGYRTAGVDLSPEQRTGLREEKKEFLKTEEGAKEVSDVGKKVVEAGVAALPVGYLGQSTATAPLLAKGVATTLVSQALGKGEIASPFQVVSGALLNLAVSKTLGGVINSMKNKDTKIKEVGDRLIRGKIKSYKEVEKALMEIPAEKIKTYQDLTKAAQDGAEATSEAAQGLAKYIGGNNKYTLKDLNIAKTVPDKLQKGTEELYKDNFFRKALYLLQKNANRIDKGEKIAISRIKEKIKKDGVALDDLHLIKKEFGKLASDKAYQVKRGASSSKDTTEAEMFQSVARGVEETMSNLIDSAAKKVHQITKNGAVLTNAQIYKDINSKTHSYLNLKGYSAAIAEDVHKNITTAAKMGLLEMPFSKVTVLKDLVSNRFSRAAVGGAVGGVSQGGISAAVLEKELPKALLNLQKLQKGIETKSPEIINMFKSTDANKVSELIVKYLFSK